MLRGGSLWEEGLALPSLMGLELGALLNCPVGSMPVTGVRMSRQMQSWRQETQQREGKTETVAKGSCLPRAEGPLTAGGVLPLGAGKKRL